jgi:chromosome segregation ATPase
VFASKLSERVRDLEASVAELKAADSRRELALAEYQSKLVGLFKRIDQRARVIEKAEAERDAQLEQLETDPYDGETVMAMRRRFGR